MQRNLIIQEKVYVRGGSTGKEWSTWRGSAEYGNPASYKSESEVTINVLMEYQVPFYNERTASQSFPPLGSLPGASGLS